MDFDFHLKTGELSEILNKLPSEIKKKVTRNAVAAGARVIRDKARVMAPYDNKRTSGTHLRDAIVNRRLKGTNDIQKIGVSAKAPHGHLVEFGTVNQPGAPFLRPAAAVTQGEVSLKMIKLLTHGILRESKKLAGKGKRK